MYLFSVHYDYAWGHAQSSDHAHLIFKTVPPLLKLAKHRCLEGLWFAFLCLVKLTFVEVHDKMESKLFSLASRMI
jgi:hypothetical protein